MLIATSPSDGVLVLPENLGGLQRKRLVEAGSIGERR
jgi:hypothetical protein